MEHKKVAIIGLGLIGGSIARALREKCGVSDITAVSRSIEAVNKAIEDNVITRGFEQINEYVYNADIIFICTPVKSTIEYVDQIAPKVKPHCIITDVGSTKGEIINHLNSMDNPPVFIGGHPMAGTEKTGYSASFTHLFENAYYILSPCKSTTDESLSLMTDYVNKTGGIPVIINADEHDRITGNISHLPHIIAACLVNLVKESDSPEGKMRMLAAGGFKDITRIASSSPEMWENIVSSNSEEILKILDNYKDILDRFASYVKSRDSEKVYEFFGCAKKYRDMFSSRNKGLIASVYEIIVDVVDKPGIIGEITTILGENGVNIKNINVSNSREFEQGCLKITLQDIKSLDTAYDLLLSKNYKVYK